MSFLRMYTMFSLTNSVATMFVLPQTVDRESKTQTAFALLNAVAITIGVAKIARSVNFATVRSVLRSTLS